MVQHRPVILIVPSYRAAATLARVVAETPPVVDEIIVIDDASPDPTAAVARDLPVTLIRHPANLGYGAAQKSGYRLALEHGARYVFMVHGDYQYDPRLITAGLELLRHGVCDVILGNRIRTRREALAGGMPIAKYLANRGLSTLANLLTGQNLGEWHTGWRGFRREVLEGIPWQGNDDGFVFDTQFLLECVQGGWALGDIPAPVRYFAEASVIGPAASRRYALASLAWLARWRLHAWGIRRDPLLAGVRRRTG